MLDLIKYLKNKGLDSLKQKFGINIIRHSKYQNLVCLKYHQFLSPMKEIIVRQCRGIILDEDRDWQVVSYPYDKFFNYQEKKAPNFDWKSAKALEKLDGSLIILYWYDGSWQVQTSSIPDASGLVKNCNFTFKELFWKIWKSLDYALPKSTNYCYMFELISPHNRVIVRYNKSDLILHGVRNLKTLQEEPIDTHSHNWKIVKQFDFYDMATAVKAVNELSPKEQEGFVIVDRYFNRIKLKSNLYVQIHNSAEEISEVKLLQIYLNGEIEEFLAYLPQHQSTYNLLMEKVRKLEILVTQEHQKFKDIADQKEYAIAISDSSFKNFLFQLKAGNKFSNILRNTSEQRLKDFIQGIRIE